MFSDPSLIQKLANNPKTASYLADPSFMAKLQAIQKNPKLSQDMFSDPRMIQVMGVAMGVDMDMAMPGQDPMGGAGAGASGSKVEEEEEEGGVPQKRPEPPKKAPEPELESEPMELDEEAQAKAEAKKRPRRRRRWAPRPTRAAVRRGDQALQRGVGPAQGHHLPQQPGRGLATRRATTRPASTRARRRSRRAAMIYADFKTIAKSYARIGTAYEKLGDMTQAIDNYNTALREHRTPDVVNKLRAAERRRIEEARHRLHRPGQGRGGARGGQPQVQGVGLAGRRGGLHGDDEARARRPSRLQQPRGRLHQAARVPLGARGLRHGHQEGPHLRARLHPPRPGLLRHAQVRRVCRRVRRGPERRYRAPRRRQHARDRAAAAEGLLGHVLGARERDRGADAGPPRARPRGKTPPKAPLPNSHLPRRSNVIPGSCW